MKASFKRVFVLLTTVFILLFIAVGCEGMPDNLPDNLPDELPETPSTEGGGEGEPEHIHTFSDWTVVKPATCTEEGITGRICSECGETESETIAATGEHVPGDWIVESQSDCYLMGRRYIECQVCQSVLNSENIATGEHSFDGGICTACGCLEDLDSYFTFTLLDDGSYSVCLHDSAPSFLESVVIPAYYRGAPVTAVKDLSFQSFLRDIKLPPTLKRIEKDSFSYIDCLIKITIPSSVEYIGDGAFVFCEALESIVFEENISIDKIEDHVFMDCRNLRTIDIPEGVNYIGDSAFSRCYSLETVNISENSKITYIGGLAFNECLSLKSLYIPDTVTHIGSYAFSQCESIESFTMPKGVTEISVGLFNGATNLTEIVLHDLITKIGDSVFSGCSSLKSFVFPAGINDFTFDFKGCASLTEIVLPEGTEYIRDFAFEGCESLESIYIPQGIKGVGRKAFYGCKKLYTEENGCCYVGVGDNPYYILCSVSNNRKNEYPINEQTRIIAGEAFRYCVLVKNIVIPENVFYIGDWAFDGCTYLETIRFEDPDGWHGYISNDEIEFTAEMMADPAAFYKIIKEKYYYYHFYKPE